MSVNIDSIKRKLLIKYPTFGSIIANLEFQAYKDIGTAATNGKAIFYNPEFLESLPEQQQVFLFAHEVCHVAFKHITRSEGKDKRIWNIATDSVINALLQQDGLKMIEGGVDIPEAVNYDAEQMYNKLLKEKHEQEKSQDGQEQQSSQGQQNQQDGQEQQSSQGGQGQQSQQDGQEQQSSQGGQGQQNQQDGQEQQKSQNSGGQADENMDVGHDTHSLWDKAIEDMKKEEQANKESKDEKGKGTSENKKDKEKNDKSEQEINELTEQGEQKAFKQNAIDRKKRLQELSKELASKSSHEPGNEVQRNGKRITDIGIATPLIDWRKILRQAITYNEEWTRKNARMRNDYFRHRIEQVPIPETEILLDTSGSVSETLLKNFLRECKNILENSRVKVGCFNTEFFGFTELRKPEDIDNMSFPIGGGTDFDVAVNAFSRRAPNKIIFTDGEADMPEKTVRNVTWIVFGNEKINPKGGKVIYITGEQLRKLYHYVQEEKKEDINR